MEANLSFGVSGEWEAFTPPALAFALFANRGRANALTYGGGLSATGCAGLRCARQPAGRSGVPARHSSPGTTQEPGAQRTGPVTCRRGSYRSAASTRHSCRVGRPRRGCTSPDGATLGAEEEADGVTARSLRRAGATCAVWGSRFGNLCARVTASPRFAAGRIPSSGSRPSD